mmetsp:Transcript_81879/g.232098  ORF Transcript_81879/g.232098 Transcript_81879/m.232098 type:complete len:267 (+) Transcript_81879:164-964(+)
MSAPFFFFSHSSCSCRAFSYTSSASSWSFFRRSRCFVISLMMCALLSLRGGAMPRNSNSSSRMRRNRRRSTRRFQWAAMRVAARTWFSRRSFSPLSPFSAWRFCRSSFRKASFRQDRTMSARLMPIRPRSFFWIMATAWSVVRPTSKGSFLSSSGSGFASMLKIRSQWSILCCLSSISSRHSLSSRKYLGTVHSTVSGFSFRSVSTSSSATKRFLVRGLKWMRCCFSSRMRTIVLFRTFFMLRRFCGCTIWSWQSSSFLYICKYLM